MNIYLAGLPGCGKSTLAAAVAQKMSRRFFDTDNEIEARERMTVAALFEKKGEAYFRAVETEILQETGAAHALIVATGGGSILAEQNVKIMRKYGMIVFINRSPALILETLNMQNRPLIKDREAFLALAATRRTLYLSRHDYMLDNMSTIDDAVDALQTYISSL